MSEEMNNQNDLNEEDIENAEAQAAEAKPKLDLVSRVALITTAVLVVLSIVLLIFIISNERDTSVIKIDIERGEQETLTFDNLALIPGEQSEYKLELNVGSTQKYDLHLDFRETHDGDLKKYARAKIIVEDEVIFDDLLSKLLEKASFSLPIDLKEKKSASIGLIYYLPEEIGNEAQDTEATFELTITAGNE